ncbi:hypothetical protein EHE22_08765 [Ochrobactrum pseudogrignonense]|uniref:Uncharacterized protein n=1 Tax=Brucella pseudogrignonensis TaxID=419475 RepID=A0A7Y3WVN0_9HYPH|nr:hypothetical protein [Brucella pseudogrignonensis]NNV20515.1 hypothetical protein [Brucella pseudogrignonensis]
MTPNPPTDNLYKFVTFLGIALVIFSTLSINSNLQKMQEADSAADAVLTSLTYNFERLSSSAIRMDKEMSEALMATREIEKQTNRDNEEVVRLRAKTEQLDTDIKTAKIKMEEIEKKARELVEISHKSQSTFKILKSQNYLMYFSLCLGLLMSILGCVSWYFFHQRYQDKLLKKTLFDN